MMMEMLLTLMRMIYVDNADDDDDNTDFKIKLFSGQMRPRDPLMLT